MIDFFNKTEYSINDIKTLIEIGAEESINLEFKSKDALQNTSKHRNELAKDVSAFANSAGGIIIYGIEEMNHAARSISFIDDEKITKEWIEQVINSNIFRKIEDLLIIPIKQSTSDRLRVFLIKIKESKIGPHMANNKYYKRYNFQSIPMEEYEIRNNYFKSQQSVLEIGNPILNDGMGGEISNPLRTTGIFKLIFTVKNLGNILEKNFKLEVSIPKSLYLRSYRNQIPFEQYSVKRYTGALDHHFVVPGKQTLFPRELLELGQVYINVKKNENLEEKIHLKLLYTGGIMRKETTLKNLININNNDVISKEQDYEN